MTYHLSITPQDASGILSLIGIIALFAAVLVLVRRSNQRRQNQTKPELVPAARPFPQSATLTKQNPSHSTADLQTLRSAFEQWKTAFVLPGPDGESEFLRGDTYKRGLRYQITSTSLSQGLAMFIRTQMAQEGDDSRASFERLLAHLLAHPAQNQPALSSWLSMPDLPTSPRLDPDLCAEVWILTALASAKVQWGELKRFDSHQIVQERLSALKDTLRQLSADQQVVFCPFGLGLIDHQRPDELWQTQTNADWLRLVPTLRESDGLPRRQQALSLMQIGLAGLYATQGGFEDWSSLAVSRLKRALSFQELPEGDVEEGFSVLASLSCCVPLALAADLEVDLSRLSALILRTQPTKHDSLGASLRLIALMCLTGTLWFE